MLTNVKNKFKNNDDDNNNGSNNCGDFFGNSRDLGFCNTVKDLHSIFIFKISLCTIFFFNFW